MKYLEKTKGGASLANNNLTKWRCCGVINNKFFCSKCGRQRAWAFVSRQYLRFNYKNKYHYFTKKELTVIQPMIQTIDATGVFIVKGNGMCGIFSIMASFVYTAEDARNRIQILTNLVKVPREVATPLLNLEGCFNNPERSIQYVERNYILLTEIFTNYFWPFLLSNNNGLFKQMELKQWNYLLI